MRTGLGAMGIGDADLSHGAGQMAGDGWSAGHGWVAALLTLFLAAAALLALPAPQRAEAVELPEPSGGPWRGYVEIHQVASSWEYPGALRLRCSSERTIRIQTAGAQQEFISYWEGELDVRNWSGPFTYRSSAEGECDQVHYDPEPNDHCQREWRWAYTQGSATPVTFAHDFLLFVGRGDPPGTSEIDAPYFGGGARWAWDSQSVAEFTVDTCSESVEPSYSNVPGGQFPDVGLDICYLHWPHEVDDPPAPGTRVHGSWSSTSGVTWPGPAPELTCGAQDGHDQLSLVSTWTWDFTYGFDADPDDPPPGDPPPDFCEPLRSGLEPCELEPGDVLLWRNAGASKAQTQWADSYFTHAAMYLGMRNLDGEPGFQFAIADALPPDKSGLLANAEVAVRDLRYTGFNDLLQVGGTDAVAVVRPNVPASARIAAADALWHHITITGGGAASIVQVGPTVEWQSTFRYPLLFDTIPDWSATGPEDFYCSSLVAWAYAEAGYPILGNTRWFAPGIVDLLYTTPDDLFDNQYGAQIVQFLSASGGDRGEVFGMHSPAHILLTDHQGRRTGKAPDGTVHDEIPGAWWVDAGHNKAITTERTRPDWTLTISGYDYGSYTLVHRVLDGSGSAPVALEGVAAPGEVVTFPLSELPARAAERTATRVAGPDRFSTAVAIARRMDPSDVVVLATGLDYPDALSAGPLAAASGAPLLLTHRGHLPGVVQDEIDRRSPSRIYLIGGHAAISADVEDHLATRYPGAQLVRLSGPNRYATSRAIAEAVRAMPGAGAGSFLVSGEAFPDAVAVSAVAAATRQAIVLTPRSRTNPETEAALQVAGGTATVVGGNAAVAEDIVVAYRAAGIDVADVRLAGPDRFATSAAVAAHFPFPADGSGRTHHRVWLSTGENFPDALAAGLGAAQHGATVLLSPSGAMAPATRAYLSGLCATGIKGITLVGGPAALSADVALLATSYVQGACDT